MPRADNIYILLLWLGVVLSSLAVLVNGQPGTSGTEHHIRHRVKKSGESSDSPLNPSEGHRPRSRAERFPSVDARVKLYMSNWYTLPCKDYPDGHIRYAYNNDSQNDGGDWQWQKLIIKGVQHHPMINASVIYELENIIEPDMIFYMDPFIVMDCANVTNSETSLNLQSESQQILRNKAFGRVKMRMNMRMYCSDVADSLLTVLDHLHWESQTDPSKAVTIPQPPTLLQFGDNRFSHVYGNVNVPHIKKFRSAVSDATELKRVTSTSGSNRCDSSPRRVLNTVHQDPGKLQPIVWKLATHRHFDKLYEVYKLDTIWSKKKDMAVFRGQLTGSRWGFDKKLSDYQNCQNLIRCRMVYNHAASSLVDAKLTHTRNRLPHTLDGVNLMSSKVSLNELLEYKGIIMIEGNDVASGLKWALLSQSVVLMPPPKHTSWAMEELLEPWVHYIPLNDMATDVEEQMQWVLDNEVKARLISDRATLWMEDLVFHPDAAEDDRQIQEEILKRYQAHFMPL